MCLIDDSIALMKDGCSQHFWYKHAHSVDSNSAQNSIPVSDIFALGESGERQRARPGHSSVSPEATTFCAGTIVSVSALSLQRMPPDVETSLQQHGDDMDSRFYCGCNNQVAN